MKKPDNLSIIVFENIADGKKVTKRLAHLFFIDIHKAIV